MPETYDWATMRERAIAVFAETPSAEFEADILAHFPERPALIAALVEQIAADVQSGSVRSGWAVLRKRLADAARTPKVTATDEREREKTIRRAETWIANAGIYFDRESEILAELFESSGILRDLDEPAVRERILETWRRERPRGERAEIEADERAERQRLQLATTRRA